MKNNFRIVLLLIVIVGGLGYKFLKAEHAQSPSQTISSATSPSTSAVPSSIASPPPSPSVQATATLAPPMDNFSGRIWLNGYGDEPSKMTADQLKLFDLQCSGAKIYPGFHTAVDLETTAAEKDIPVAVHSIADGVVREAGPVSGYGGLIVV